MKKLTYPFSKKNLLTNDKGVVCFSYADYCKLLSTLFFFIFIASPSFYFANDGGFIITSNTVVSGLDRVHTADETANNQGKVYVLANTTFVANTQISVPIQYIEKKNHHSAEKISKKILKSVYTDKKVGKSYNGDLPQIKLPSKDRQSNIFLLSVSDLGIVPSSPNHHNKNTFDKNQLLFFTKQPISIYKQQNFTYHKFVKVFALEIVLVNRPPPISRYKILDTRYKTQDLQSECYI